jgi:Methyltransferase domain
MDRHGFLAALHEVVRPRTYLEIGVNDGRSLTLSRAPSVAIDPGFVVNQEICTDVHLVRATSDEFFARKDPLAHLPRPLIDLAFIDGMHLSDYALRDYMNVERYSAAASVIVFDDMLPRNVDEAARERHTRAWTGDVYKVIQALRRLRPDVLALEVATDGSGTGMILLPDPDSTVLHDRYDDLVAEMVVPDPQDVPADVLGRTHAVDPEKIVQSSVWAQLVHLRDRPMRSDREQVAQLYASAGWQSA